MLISRLVRLADMTLFNAMSYAACPPDLLSSVSLPYS